MKGREEEGINNHEYRITLLSCRVAHLLANLGLDDFDLCCSTLSLVLPRLRGILAEVVQGENSSCSKPPVDLRTKVPLWPGLSWPGQVITELLF